MTSSPRRIRPPAWGREDNRRAARVPQALHDVPVDAKIVVYCSVGCRSEGIGERLEELGYRDVSNLYGSIFEWVNRGYEVVDAEGRPVRALHTYNENWSRWVTNEEIGKIW